jgi:hypothetical protein
MKKIILIILAVLFASATPWLFIGADAWAEMTALPSKFYQCSSVVTFWAALFLMNAANEKETQKSNK